MPFYVCNVLSRVVVYVHQGPREHYPGGVEIRTTCGEVRNSDEQSVTEDWDVKHHREEEVYSDKVALGRQKAEPMNLVNPTNY
ncbi:hypothetical protein LMH87_002152 [Akanthomyces muscarius]|uniref:Uncharacterized protein n=1 Tax=Akanthomyces muscarius TaxID=2231603 RepID=A0A9W8Q882_AKAMU|nr:hypothetical protein LMH87_002152 [Akanthomyces muscarius]KAJ4147641.1 hypothetical protein LMH87_002152 [Akanthomyces muscarius]